MRRWLISCVLCFGVTTAARGDWQQATSRHFIVYADNTPDKVRELTTRLERHDKVMRVLHGTADPAISPNSRVTVFVVPSVAAVNKLLNSGGVAGFYMARASGSVAFVPRRSDEEGKGSLSPEEVLFHEYAHHFMYSSMRDAVVPAWLSEGFAEFHATTEFEPNGDVLVGKVPLYRAYGIMQGSDLPMETLLNASSNKFDPARAQMFYGRGWLLTHYLTVDPARRAQMTAYLAALNDGKSSKEAAKVFGNPKTLQRGLQNYLRTPLDVFSIPAKLLPIDPVIVRSLTPAETAIMPVRILSQRGVDAHSSREVAAQARKVAARFPNDPAAQNELAEAELDASDPGASIAAADRALAADPTSIHAMMYAGLARIAAARKATPVDGKAIEKARDWLRRANHADPENPWPMQEYYLSYLAAGEAPTANAENGLLYARELAPFDPNLGLTAAYVYLIKSKVDEAARVLKPIAYDPHGGPRATFAQTVLTSLAKDGPIVAAGLLRAKGAPDPQAALAGAAPRH